MSGSWIDHLARCKEHRIWILKTRRQVLFLSLTSCVQSHLSQQLSFLAFNKEKEQCLLTKRFCENSTGTSVFQKMEMAM